MKFELHCHTNFSRGSNIPTEALLTPEEIFSNLKKKGFAGIAITDHDTNKGWKNSKIAAKKYGMIFIPGIEISSSDGHIVGLGLNETIKKGKNLNETIDMIHSQGGIAIAAHPFDPKGEGVRTRLKRFDAVEVFNSLNMDRISNNMAKRKAEYFGKTMVAGSDAHTVPMLGLSENRIKAENLDCFLREIKKGRVTYTGRYCSTSDIVNWSRQRLKQSRKEVLEYVNRNYSAPRAWIAKKMMDKFINSYSPFWDYLAKFGYSATAVYSFFKVLRYY